LAKACALSNDAEARFNLAAILEASGELEQAEEHYEIALTSGVEQASENLRAVRAKIASKKK
jgi:tetratricopeptide (TPR) repeat protein